MFQKLCTPICPALAHRSHTNPATQPSTSSSTPPLLPVELVRDIIDLSLADLEQSPNSSEWQQILSNYCLVHSTWRAYAQPILFRTLRLTPWIDARRMVRNLKTNKTLLKASVKRIEIVSYFDASYRTMATWDEGAKLASQLAGVSPQVDTLLVQGLRTSRLHNYSGGFRNLRTLCLINISMSWRSMLFSRAHTSDVFPSVTTLILYDCWIHHLSRSFDSVPPFPSLKFLSMLYFRTSLRGSPITPRFESLLHGPQLLCLSTDKYLHIYRCPNLKSLTIHYCVTATRGSRAIVNEESIRIVLRLSQLEELRIDMTERAHDPLTDLVAARWLVGLLHARSSGVPTLKKLKVVYVFSAWKVPVRRVLGYGQEEAALVQEVRELCRACEESGLRIVWEENKVGDTHQGLRDIEKFREQCGMTW